MNLSYLKNNINNIKTNRIYCCFNNSKNMSKNCNELMTKKIKYWSKFKIKKQEDCINFLKSFRQDCKNNLKKKSKLSQSICLKV